MYGNYFIANIYWIRSNLISGWSERSGKRVKYEVLEKGKAVSLRKKFIERFIDDSDPNYIEMIANTNYEDENCYYNGYLWDYLIGNGKYELECSMEDACNTLLSKDKILVMWDVFSDRYVNDPSFFAKNLNRSSVIEVEANEVARAILKEWNDDIKGNESYFPDDIYCYDEKLNWCVIFTHETWDSYATSDRAQERKYIRICFRVI